MKVALTIAGSDSGGGAGIQADLKTFAALGVYGTSVITALTAQNTTAVTRVEITSPGMVAAQLDAVLDDFPVRAAKTGMLANAATIEAVVAVLSRRPIANLVVDPVMVSKSGASLLAPEAVAAMKSRLLPLARVVTPNLPEAEALAGTRDPVEAARAIAALGPQVVVVKGGHAEGDVVKDVAWIAGEVTTLSGPRLHTTSTHGTGCTLSAAIAAWLARGAEPLDAITRARKYLEAAIAGAKPLGKGHGPTHHLHPFYPWD